MPALTGPLYAAVVFADRWSAVGLLERMTNPQRLSGAGFDTAVGTIGDNLVVAATPASEPADFARILSALRNAYQPQLVLGAGFSQAIGPSTQLGAKIIASRVVKKREHGETESFRMSSVDGLPSDWGTGVLAEGDMDASDESLSANNNWCFRFAQACADHATPAAVATVINQKVGEGVDSEVQNVLRQPSTAGRAGALLRALWRRPSSIVDLAQRKSREWENQEKLADLVESILASL